MNQLQKALRVNALFSGLSGLALILFHQSIAGIFGLDTSTAFWVTGVALIFFAATIVYEIRKLRRMAVVWIIVQDFLWVLGSLFLLLLNPFDITSEGNAGIAIVALIVLFMGINQSRALAQEKSSGWKSNPAG